MSPEKMVSCPAGRWMKAGYLINSITTIICIHHGAVSNQSYLEHCHSSSLARSIKLSKKRFIRGATTLTRHTAFKLSVAKAKISFVCCTPIETALFFRFLTRYHCGMGVNINICCTAINNTGPWRG